MGCIAIKGLSDKGKELFGFGASKDRYNLRVRATVVLKYNVSSNAMSTLELVANNHLSAY